MAPEVVSWRRQQYDAVISYSHAVDGRLAPAVQRVLHQLAKPFLRPPRMRVFRDQTSLSAHPDLWAAVESALGSSRFFVLMASPEAAQSRWVQKEIDFWKSHRSCDTFLIVATAGEIVWDGTDFDWTRTTALPRSLSGWFTSEPLWVDLRWARHEEQVDARHNLFRDKVASLAAAIHGISKDQLDSEDIRQLRRSQRIRSIAVSALSVLFVLATVLGMIAYQQRSAALDQARIASARALVRQPQSVI
ncbi:MAG: TIR domain-containing protein, partial [Pseudonocardiaceae bacterium]